VNSGEPNDPVKWPDYTTAQPRPVPCGLGRRDEPQDRNGCDCRDAGRGLADGLRAGSGGGDAEGRELNQRGGYELQRVVRGNQAALPEPPPGLGLGRFLCGRVAEAELLERLAPLVE